MPTTTTGWGQGNQVHSPIQHFFRPRVSDAPKSNFFPAARFRSVRNPTFLPHPDSNPFPRNEKRRLSQNETPLSHFRERPRPIFSPARISPLGRARSASPISMNRPPAGNPTKARSVWSACGLPPLWRAPKAGAELRRTPNASRPRFLSVKRPVRAPGLHVGRVP